MKETKFIVRVAMSVALLIALQMALTAISGVELVTVILLCLSFCYGMQTGLAIATTFSLLRCFFFGYRSGLPRRRQGIALQVSSGR